MKEREECSVFGGLTPRSTIASIGIRFHLDENRSPGPVAEANINFVAGGKQVFGVVSCKGTAGKANQRSIRVVEDELLQGPMKL